MDEELNIPQEPTEQEYNELLRVRREKLSALREAGEDPFVKTTYKKTASAARILANLKKYENKKVSIAGRMVSRRVMGKAAFAHVLDGTGQIQIYVKTDEVGETVYEAFKRADIGDIFGVAGTVFVTHKGEISVKAAKIELLSKSLLPLPEKYHGLRDPDLRYRQRYVDLIANPEVKNTFIMRGKIINAVRSYLNKQGFTEVETPILNIIPGGAAARPFKTFHNTLGLDMHLRIAPELYLKRLIVGGFEKVYEIGRNFRNEGMSPKHNPEFTMMELYQAYADFRGMMDLTENIFANVLKETGVAPTVTYQGTEINLAPPWRRLTMVEAVREYAGFDFDKLDFAGAYAAAKELRVPLDKADTWGRVLYAVFDSVVEEKLIQPTFIYDYPVEESPLAKRKPSDSRLTERFEFFIYAREMGNAYSELNDPIDQKERFEAQAALRAKGDEEALRSDDDFVTALEYGMPPTGGLGIGIDRLVMLLTDSASIRDVILFPTMKPK